MLSGATLCIPFSFSVSNKVVTAYWDGSQSNGANDTDLGKEIFGDSYAKLSNNITSDSTASYVSTYRKSLVTLNSKLTIESGATLQIGGVTGQASTPVSGMTTGVYSEIAMGSNGVLDISGEVNCLGYIKEVNTQNNGSSIIVRKNGSLTEPMIIFDFHSITDVENFTYNSIYPFNQYDFVNIQPQITIEYGASFNGKWDIYDSKHYGSTLSIIGTSNSLFNLKEDGYVNIKYNSYSNEYTYWGSDSTSYQYSSSNTYDVDSYKGYTTYNFYNGMDFGPIDMTFNTKSVTSSTYEFPFSYHQQIVLNDGTYSMNNKFKFKPGSSLTISKDATLNQTSNLIFYQSLPNNMTKDSDDYAYYYPNIKSGSTITNKARFIVDGKYHLSDGWFGGYIETNQVGAIVELDSTANIGTSATEGYGYNNWVNSRKCEHTTQSESGLGKLSKDKGVTLVDDAFKKNATYTSTTNSNGEFYWPIVTHVLSVNAYKKDYKFGDVGAYFARYKVYVSTDGTDSTMESEPIITQDTGTWVNASVSYIYCSYDLAEKKWFKIVTTERCDSISGGYQLNTWYQMGTEDITITIQRTKR